MAREKRDIEEKVVSDMEQQQTVIVSLDKSDTTVLNLNGDESLLLDWDPDDFRILPEEVVDKLRRDNLRRYTVAETKYKQVQAARNAASPRKFRVDPIAAHSDFRMTSKLPKNHGKAGWHFYWAGPAEDFERCMQSGYKQVRGLDTKQEAEFKETGKLPEPGAENGEVIKLMDAEGKVEHILLEIKQDLFEEHLEFQAAESQSRLGIELKERFFTEVDNLNRTAPTRNVRLKAFDGDDRVV